MKDKIKKNKEIIFEFTGKNHKKIISYVLEKATKGHYKNDLIGLKITSEFKSGNSDVVMTPYEAFLISNALSNAVLFHKQSNKRFLK